MTRQKNILARFSQKTAAAVSTLALVGSVFTPITALAVDADPSNPLLSTSCGINIALVLDSSDSMSNDDIQDVKDAANALASAMMPETPAQIRGIDFDTDVINSVAPTTNQTAVTNAINAIGHTPATETTNWDAALDAADAMTGAGDLVVIITDGNPTAHNGAGSDLQNAIDSSNAIQGQGTRILAIGIDSSGGNSDGLNVDNLKAISGPTVVNFPAAITGINDVDVATGNVADLGPVLQDIASALCGGTINVSKVIDGDAAFNTANYLGGIDFSIAGEDASTNSIGNAGVSVQSAGPWSVTEDVPAGFTFVSASCVDQNQASVGTPAENGVTGIMLTDVENDVITCTFHNAPNFGLVKVTKTVVINDNEYNDVAGDFTMKVMNGETTLGEFAGSNAGTWTEVPGGTSYSVTETGENVSNYFQQYEGSCDDVTVDAGETYTCDVTNDDFAPNTADVSVTKSVDDSSVDVGQEVVYTIVAKNNGVQNVHDVVVNDVLPSGVTYVANSADMGSYDSNTGVWTVGDLEIGEQATLLITVTINNVEAETVITNTASVTFDQSGDEPTDPNESNDSDSASVTVNTPDNESNPQCSDGINNDPEEDYTSDVSDPGCYTNGTYDPNDNDEHNPTQSNNGGGGGGGGGNGPISTSGGGFGGPVGSVLGASTTLPELPAGCTALIETYMRWKNKKNDPADVKDLQGFLNKEMGTNIPVTGVFGPMTDAGVRAFQTKYADETLTPWGLTETTGFVYKTTQRWVNLIHCKTLNIPRPTNLTPYQHEDE